MINIIDKRDGKKLTDNIQLSKKQPLQILRKKYQEETKDAPERTAKGVFVGGLKGIMVAFGSFFGAIISSDIIKVNWLVVLLLFAFIGMAGYFLYDKKKDQKENKKLIKRVSVLEDDMVVMAKTKVEIVDIMEEDFSSRLDKSMTFLEKTIEGRYSDTIVGLSCQVTDLIKQMGEERDKLHLLITSLTTETDNGIGNMTTEV